MATTNHVCVPNFAPSSTTAIFNLWWKLARAMQKAGWKYLASSDGTTKESGTVDPELNKWGSGTVTNAGATAAIAIAAPSRGRAIVTGLSGIVALDKGRFLHLDGFSTPANNHWHQIEEVISASSVAIDARNFAVAAESGTFTWEIRDVLGTSYPSGLNSVQAWILLRGPSTLKIPITAAPSAGPTGLTFVRGENIVQATTGAEGEIVGFVYYSGTGYLVVAPRLRGTGTGVYGWDTGNAIAGDVSGATVTQNGTALEYRHEFVIWKNNNTNTGTIFVGCFEPVGEASQMFSTVAASAGCTNLIAPGGGGTGNAFPTFAYVAHGANATGTGYLWHGHQSTSYDDTCGNAQIMVADAIEEQGHSADGSWILPRAITQAAGGGHAGMAFQRLDDSEDGDLDPYVFFNGNAYTPLYGNNRTVANSGGPQSSNWEQFTSNRDGNGSAVYVAWKGWRGRGITGDSGSNYQDFEECVIKGMCTSYTVLGNALSTNTASGDRLVTALTPTKTRIPMWISSLQANRKMHKGTPRWLHLVQGGNGTDLYDNRTWVQLSPTSAAFVGGPWDGASIATAF